MVTQTVQARSRTHVPCTVCPQVLGKHDEAVKCVAHNTSNGLVVSGSWDATVRLWDVRAPEGSGRSVGTLALPGKVFSMSCSDTRLVVATAGRRVQVYDLRSLHAGAAPEQERESLLKFQVCCLQSCPSPRMLTLSVL